MPHSEIKPLNDLLAKAREIATGLNGVTQGKPPEAIAKSNAKTFSTVASILNELSDVASETNRDALRWRKALNRIANLEVRSAAELLERQQWARISIELQAIAQEGLGDLNHH